MPRTLTYSNGRLFVGVDSRSRIRELTWPHVGLHNHLNGYSIRMGVFVDHQFAWLDDDGWERSQDRCSEHLGRHTLEHPGLGLRIEILEGVDPDTDAFFRQVKLTDLSQTQRHVTLYSTHDLRIDESDIGDTALFDPSLPGIIHYKRGTWIGLQFAGDGELDYATGTKAFGGLEGTWRDAEDGHLSRNPIAQGSVDSTLGIRVVLGPKASVGYRISFATTREELLQRTSAPIPRPTRPTEPFSAEQRSTAFLESFVDAGGAVLAAVDSDILQTARAHYGYCWPRDGALIARVLDSYGKFDAPRRFFEFVERIFAADTPMLLQKYHPDGTVGASWHPWIVDGRFEVPHQLDETALSIWAACRFARQNGDTRLAASIKQVVIDPWVAYLAGPGMAGGLPLPCYDLWEERRGVHAFTVATVIAALQEVAALFGREDAAALANTLRNTLLSTFTDPELGFARTRNADGTLDFTPDSSLLALALLGAFEVNDPAMETTIARLERELWVKAPFPGMARYSGDYYFRASDSYSGNPWGITTLWLAQVSILQGNPEKAEHLLRLVESTAADTGALPEQWNPDTGEALSVAPLAWSHAEHLRTRRALRSFYELTEPREALW